MNNNLPKTRQYAEWNSILDQIQGHFLAIMSVIGLLTSGGKKLDQNTMKAIFQIHRDFKKSKGIENDD